jgi:hypothetical protein
MGSTGRSEGVLDSFNLNMNHPIFFYIASSNDNSFDLSLVFNKLSTDNYQLTTINYQLTTINYQLKDCKTTIYRTG